ncbi:uncharacterized protein EDB91DRAFT_786826 [Suillus paluster]|uniref:uncharacterized protein n=1 Tax=Suillus paluster TaxID=48578 RepID=UPI001B85D1CE|nr:uncharacterized protein EDB91DRAFT_786826 [Suillus paluster]KAG1730417.1 hypothetical protein EDB91DRAFT_786826 [Suillus paluster]
MTPSGFFKGDTSMEIIAIIASSGNDVNTVRDAVIMYIVAKRNKGRSEQHIHEKLEKLERKFKDIEALHPAWRDARALFQLRKSEHIPIPMSIVRQQENEQRRKLEWELSSVIPSSPAASSASNYTSSAASNRLSSVPSTYSPAASSASNYTSSAASNRLSSVPSTYSSSVRLSWEGKNDLPRAEEDKPIEHSVLTRTRRDTALSLLSEYSDDSEPDDQVFTSPSGDTQT